MSLLSYYSHNPIISRQKWSWFVTDILGNLHELRDLLLQDMLLHRHHFPLLPYRYCINFLSKFWRGMKGYYPMRWCGHQLTCLILKGQNKFGGHTYTSLHVKLLPQIDRTLFLTMPAQIVHIPTKFASWLSDCTRSHNNTVIGWT